MAQKPKEKVARSAPKKPATRAPKPKKKTTESGKTSRGAKSAARPRTRPAAKTAPRKAVTANAERGSTAISREQWQAMVAEAAYFMAERRGFAGGDPEQDWREAEAEINALLQR